MDNLELTMEEVRLDTSRIGTDEYTGVAYFWNKEYRHILRDLEDETRVKIHSLFILNNLDVNGKSDLHLELILKTIENE